MSFESPFSDLIELIIKALDYIFHGSIPRPLLFFGACLVIVFASLLAIYGFLLLISKIYKTFVEDIIPIFYNEQKRRRRDRRSRFAKHIEHEITKLNLLEVWEEHRYAELEAEVEAEGSQKALIPFSRNRQSLRREKSLTRALQRTSERLILLEGDPGSGKSVALRHFTLEAARVASKSKQLKAIIPIYVNMRQFDLKDRSVPVTQNMIRDFVIRTINRANSTDIERFIDEEFDTGLKDGTWLFIFDSFDEIPAVLDAVDANNVIREYSEAIEDFLSGMNRCRGMIASREYKGPRLLGWPRFRILPLTESRQKLLIKKYDLRNTSANHFVGELGNAPSTIQSLVSNPMFLSLLCGYFQQHRYFPQNGHTIYEDYINNRLIKDEVRLQRRFGITPQMLKDSAEKLAFCMSAQTDIGLSPLRNELYDATLRQNLPLEGDFNIILNALEYVKLARPESDSTLDSQKSFSFSHRRFQEYFATSIVLKEPGRVNPNQLLTNGRWRETAVILLQTQPEITLQPLLTELKSLVSTRVSEIADLGFIVQESKRDKSTQVSQFTWPSEVIHLFNLIQDGFVGNLADIPLTIKRDAGRLLIRVIKTGTRLDKKWAIEVAGVAPQYILLQILRDAFNSNSPMLSNVAYRQVSRLRKLTRDIENTIYQTLISMEDNESLRRDRFVTRTYLARLDKARRFLSTMDLLLSIKPTIIILHIVLLAVFAYSSWLIRSNEPQYILTRTIVFSMVVSSVLLIMQIFANVYSIVKKGRAPDQLNWISTYPLIITIFSATAYFLYAFLDVFGIMQGISMLPEMPWSHDAFGLSKLRSEYSLPFLLLFVCNIWREAAIFHASKGRFGERYWRFLIPWITVPLHIIIDIYEVVYETIVLVYHKRKDVLSTIGHAMLLTYKTTTLGTSKLFYFTHSTIKNTSRSFVLILNIIITGFARLIDSILNVKNIFTAVRKITPNGIISLILAFVRSTTLVLAIIISYFITIPVFAMLILIIRLPFVISAVICFFLSRLLLIIEWLFHRSLTRRVRQELKTKSMISDRQFLYLLTQVRESKLATEFVRQVRITQRCRFSQNTIGILKSLTEQLENSLNESDKENRRATKRRTPSMNLIKRTPNDRNFVKKLPHWLRYYTPIRVCLFVLRMLSPYYGDRVIVDDYEEMCRRSLRNIQTYDNRIGVARKKYFKLRNWNSHPSDSWQYRNIIVVQPTSELIDEVCLFIEQLRREH